MTTDPVTLAVAALIEHDATCHYCANAADTDPSCPDRLTLIAARRALTGRAETADG